MKITKKENNNLFRRVLRKPLGRISFIFIAILFISAVFADFIAPMDPNELDTVNIFAKPCPNLLF